MADGHTTRRLHISDFYWSKEETASCSSRWRKSSRLDGAAGRAPCRVRLRCLITIPELAYRIGLRHSSQQLVVNTHLSHPKCRSSLEISGSSTLHCLQSAPDLCADHRVKIILTSSVEKLSLFLLSNSWLFRIVGNMPT